MNVRDEDLTITLSRREWVKICAALVMRTGVDRHAQPLIEKLHPLVIEPLIEADRATTDRPIRGLTGCPRCDLIDTSADHNGRGDCGTDREVGSPDA